MLDFSGTWRVNFSSSKLIGPQPQGIVFKIEHAEPRLAQIMTITSGNGEEQADFAFSTDGEESVNLIRGAEWRTRAHWEGGELIIESFAKTPARQFRFRDCWSLQNDATVLVMEHRGGDLDAQRAVLDRV